MRDSGHIQFDGDMIRYRSDGCGGWDLALSDIRVIGECTNQSGPCADDYFFCFATGPGMWHEASFYANGRDEFLRLLSQKLETPIEAGLCNSTDFASRVLWPASLADQPMFSYKPVHERGFFRRILFMGRNEQSYSQNVVAQLTGAG